MVLLSRMRSKVPVFGYEKKFSERHISERDVFGQGIIVTY